MGRISLEMFRRDDDHFIFSPFSARHFFLPLGLNGLNRLKALNGLNALTKKKCDHYHRGYSFSGKCFESKN